jgi:hypothetical protein
MGLDAVELIMEIEREFGVDIPPRSAENLETVGELYDWLKLRVINPDPDNCSQAQFEQNIWERLELILVEKAKVRRFKIKPEARIRKDLGLG